MIFGGIVLAAAIGFGILGSVDLPKLFSKMETQTEPKQPERLVPEQPVEHTDPFKSLVLDAAQSYLAFGRLPVAPGEPRAKPNLTR